MTVSVNYSHNHSYFLSFILAISVISPLLSASSCFLSSSDALSSRFMHDLLYYLPALALAGCAKTALAAFVALCSWPFSSCGVAFGGFSTASPLRCAQMECDEKEMRREISYAIKNIHGIR